MTNFVNEIAEDKVNESRLSREIIPEIAKKTKDPILIEDCSDNEV